MGQVAVDEVRRTHRSAWRRLEPIALGTLIAAVQVGCFAVFWYYTQLGVGKPSDSEFANWHVEAQLFWISALLIASFALIYLALRRLKVPYAGALVLPVVIVELAAGAYVASKLPGPADLRAAVLAVVLSAELVGLTAGRRRGPDVAGRWAEPLGIGLLITAVQFALLIFDQFLGVYEPPRNVLHLRIDRQLIWFVLVLGGSSVVMVYLALRHLAVSAAGWVVVPAVLLQFALVAAIDAHAMGFGHMGTLLVTAILPAELLTLSLRLGKHRPRL